MNKYKFEPKIINIKVLDNYQIFVTFDDNISGIVNCMSIIKLPFFVKLKEYSYFRQAIISGWGRGDITWPNGEDMSAMQIYNEFTQLQQIA